MHVLEREREKEGKREQRVRGKLKMGMMVIQYNILSSYDGIFLFHGKLLNSKVVLLLLTLVQRLASYLNKSFTFTKI